MHIPIKRSEHNKIFGGVIGGIAEHFGWGVAPARIIYLILSLLLITTGLGPIVYLVFWLLMENPDEKKGN